MRFLTFTESADWCSQHGYPTRQREDRRVGPDPDIPASEFHSVGVRLPTDSGRKVWLARFLYELLAPSRVNQSLGCLIAVATSLAIGCSQSGDDAVDGDKIIGHGRHLRGAMKPAGA
jgi:hypothetical protein